MSQKAEELKNVYESLDEETKKSMNKLEKLIEKNSMTPEQVELLVEKGERAVIEQGYPELMNLGKISSAERMSVSEYAELYKKMAEEFEAHPEKYEEHAKASGMEVSELSGLFKQINTTVVRYPEVFESREKAEMLHPKNLAILVNAFKKDKKEEE